MEVTGVDGELDMGLCAMHHFVMMGEMCEGE